MCHTYTYTHMQAYIHIHIHSHHLSWLSSLFEMHHENFLVGVFGSDVRHHIGRLFTTELAIGTLETWLLAAFVLEVSSHVALDGKAATALRTCVRLFTIDECTGRVGVLYASISVIIHHRPRRGGTNLSWEIPGTTVVRLKDFTGLQHEAHVQLRNCRVET